MFEIHLSHLKYITGICQEYIHVLSITMTSILPGHHNNTYHRFRAVIDSEYKPVCRPDKTLYKNVAATFPLQTIAIAHYIRHGLGSCIRFLIK